MKFCDNLGESATETLAMIRQVFGEDSMSHTQVFEWHARFKGKPKHVNSKVKSILNIFVDIRGNVDKSILLVGLTVNFANYCDVLRRLRENM
jgi:hypothetical protein